MKHGFTSFIATWFGSGNAPFAPGTFGSLAALPIGFVIHNAFGSAMLAVFALILFAVGVWVTDMYMQLYKKTGDPKEVVIDEVAGQWLLLAFVPPTFWGYVVAFMLFRLFDIFKPWPISWLEKKYRNGFGVMIDDIAAAVMGVIAYWLLDAILFSHFIADTPTSTIAAG